ncbi:hypothetical protein CKF46_37020, partial [Klebsiella pneumoniae]
SEGAGQRNPGRCALTAPVRLLSAFHGLVEPLGFPQARCVLRSEGAGQRNPGRCALTAPVRLLSAFHGLVEPLG